MTDPVADNLTDIERIVKEFGIQVSSVMKTCTEVFENKSNIKRDFMYVKYNYVTIAEAILIKI